MENSLIGTALITVAMAGYLTVHRERLKEKPLELKSLLVMFFSIVIDGVGTFFLIKRSESLQLYYFIIITVAAFIAMILYFGFLVYFFQKKDKNSIPPSVQKFFRSCFIWRCFVFVMGILLVMH